MDRSKLPYRKNCEGYFIDRNGNILAKLSKQGFVVFPGGGIEENERVEDGMIRETLEETGVVIKRLRSLGVVSFIWGPEWAKTEKQKKRYEQFKGDEMHFFSGEVMNFVNQENKEEDSWNGNKFMPIDKVIENVSVRLSANKDDQHVFFQLKFLIKLKEEMQI